MWRRGRFGPFVACSNYPTCKYIKKKEAKLSACRAPTARRGRWWSARAAGDASSTAATAIPECKFTAYHRPIAETCPDCGRAYLLEKETKKEGHVVFCGNEACHFKRKAE